MDGWMLSSTPRSVHTAQLMHTLCCCLLSAADGRCAPSVGATVRHYLLLSLPTADDDDDELYCTRTRLLSFVFCHRMPILGCTRFLPATTAPARLKPHDLRFIPSMTMETLPSWWSCRTIGQEQARKIGL